MTAPTPLPWTINEVASTELWIEGPEGSAATEEFPRDRQVVCFFPTSGEAEDLKVALANANLILEAVAGAGGR